MAAASSVLHNMLTSGVKATSPGNVILKEVDAGAWKAVLDYMYTGKMNLVDVDKALEYLKCADWLQMEELVQVISDFIERKLEGENCFQILLATNRLGLRTLREKVMKMIVDNFHDMWSSDYFICLPFDVVLEILQCDELVVRDELDIFLAVIRWLGWSGASAMWVLEKRTCELIEEHTGLHLLDVYIGNADTCDELKFNALFECVDISKFTNVDLQIAGGVMS